MTQPIASVIIPNWNGQQWLDKCLRSLLGQTLQPVEIIVVDNASTDGSADHVERAYPAVRLLRLPENRGFSVACNTGIRASSGAFVSLFNNDAWAEPSWLETMVKAMGDDAMIGAAACRTLDYHDPARLYSLGDGCLPNGDGFNIARGMRDRPDLPMPRWIFGPPGCTAFYRRAALDAVGLLDEDFFAFHEDVDLNWRLQLAGYRCLYVPEAVAYHVGYASARKASDRFAFMSGRNRWFVLLKNWPWSLWLRFAPQLVYRQAQWLWWALKGNHESWVRCRGTLSVLRFLPRELRKRRAVQRLRRVGAGELVAMLKAHETLRRQLKAVEDQGAKVERHG
ncbi:MAG: glycosyltransferase family 2 protein [Verrucomicrobia bacterium]|nr:glycosyltransferase family 2 protein [Verrucomicrobiota bacterium]